MNSGRIALRLLFVAGLMMGQTAFAALAVSDEPFEPRPVASWLEAQVELHRRGFSCGSIDSIVGARTRTALLAFQRSQGVPATGELDDATGEHLILTSPALVLRVCTEEEIAVLRPVPPTWLEKSQQENLPHGTVLEYLAEQHRAAPNFLRRLNPAVDWDTPTPGLTVTVPAVETATVAGLPARVIIWLEARRLEVVAEEGRTIAQFPVSIARRVEKRPIGELHVTVAIPEPNYTFDPAVFPESPEAATLGRKLIIPPGANNPVGRAWIGLDRPGYGIHGTPDPENVGRTESHGCFRLANWDALTLLRLIYTGMVVVVEP